MRFFDYTKVAQEAGLNREQLKRLENIINSEFPNDAMMFELHMLRACKAIKDGFVSYEDAIKEEQKV